MSADFQAEIVPLGRSTDTTSTESTVKWNRLSPTEKDWALSEFTRTFWLNLGDCSAWAACSRAPSLTGTTSFADQDRPGLVGFKLRDALPVVVVGSVKVVVCLLAPVPNSSVKVPAPSRPSDGCAPVSSGCIEEYGGGGEVPQFVHTDRSRAPGERIGRQAAERWRGSARAPKTGSS